MTALAKGKPGANRAGETPIPARLSFPVKGGVIIYQGALVALNAGYLAPATSAAGLVVIGRAVPKATVDNSAGADGAVTCEVEQGAILFENSAAGDAIAQADAGAVCYAVDDQTVAKTSNNGARSVAGRVVGIEGTRVRVLCGLAVDRAAPPTIQAGTATLVAGTVTVAGVAITATSRIQVTRKTGAGTLGNLSAPSGSRTTGASGSFVINSDQSSETSTVDYLIVG